MAWAPIEMELLLHEKVWCSDEPEEWEMDSFDVADIDITVNDVIYNTFLSSISAYHYHISPRDWYSLVWFRINFEYYDSVAEWTKTWNTVVYTWDTTTFWDLIPDRPSNFDGYFTFEAWSIREKNSDNVVTTSFKNNVEYKLWGGGGGEWGLVRADNSPDKPKYWRVGSEEDYQALENKYTEQENDTLFFTY